MEGAAAVVRDDQEAQDESKLGPLFTSAAPARDHVCAAGRAGQGRRRRPEGVALTGASSPAASMP
jgi:hypothetical protein